LRRLKEEAEEAINAKYRAETAEREKLIAQKHAQEEEKMRKIADLAKLKAENEKLKAEKKAT